ncbi:ABC transporter ATP-binding protein [Staphylococcus aureus]|nr:ABC transporter ATP-binding protein [Staphylococcus aureus]
MFQITFKILNWIRPYKARMILGDDLLQHISKAKVMRASLMK